MSISLSKSNSKVRQRQMEIFKMMQLRCLRTQITRRTNYLVAMEMVACQEDLEATVATEVDLVVMEVALEAAMEAMEVAMVAMEEDIVAMVAAWEDTVWEEWVWEWEWVWVWVVWV